MREVKHVIEHKIPQPQTNLPPINQQRAPPVIFQQPPPPAQVIPMQQPTPQIIAAPAAPHIIYGNPSPVIHNLGQPERKAGMFNKEGELLFHSLRFNLFLLHSFQKTLQPTYGEKRNQLVIEKISILLS